MKSQDLNQEQKLQIIMCGPLPQTEAALLRRGDVEIIRENDNLNLLGGMANGFIDCDMIIVEAPYGHGLYSMTYPVGERKTCPVWMVADPPDEFVWKEINWQLSEVPAKRREARRKAIAAGPPKHEILLLTDTPQRRSDFSGWMREIYAIWKMTLPPLVAPEDVKAYLRELHELQKEDVPPELVVIAMEGVDSLNIADHIRELYPKTGLIWSCDLNFSLQAFHHQADYFFFLNEASRETLGTGLTRWQYRVEQHKDRGNEQ